jgi:hypothetical protein
VEWACAGRAADRRCVVAHLVNQAHQKIKNLEMKIIALQKD